MPFHLIRAANFEAQDRWNAEVDQWLLAAKGEKTSEIAQLDHISPESENCSGGREGDRFTDLGDFL